MRESTDSDSAPGFDAARTLSERGMTAVQEMIEVLRLNDRELFALAQRVDHLEQLACADDLTGLPNRRGLELQLHREEARAVRYGSPVAVVMIGLDGIDAVAERHGPGAADALIRALAATLRNGARASDVVARYDRDAFVALLLSASMEGSRAFMARVGTVTQYARLPTGEVVPIVTVTGAATRDEAGSLGAAIELAEQRLTAAKQRTSGPPPAPERDAGGDGTASDNGTFA